MRQVILRKILPAAVLGLVLVSLAAPAWARKWTFGPFNAVEAEVDSYDGKRVRLKLGDTVFNVEVDKLSAEDQAYLKQTYPNGKVREKKPKAAPAATESETPAESPPTEAAAATEADPQESPAAAAAASKLDPIRVWSGSGNGLQIRAALDSYDGKTAWLALSGEASSMMKVPLEKLSEADQAYLKKTYPNGKQGAGIAAELAAKTDAKRPTPPTAPAPSSARTAAAKPSTPGSATEAQEIQVEVVSLTVTKPTADGQAVGGLVPGTHATLLVSSPAKKLLRLDAEKTRIDCADDRAALLNKPAPGSDSPEGGMMLEVGPDGQSGTLVLDFPRPPTPKATRIRLKGELHLVCGTDDSPETVVIPLEVILSLGL